MEEQIKIFLNTSSGSGDGSGSGSGYGSGDGSGGEGIKEIYGCTVYSIDNMPTIISRIHGNYAKGFVLNEDLTLTPCFVVKGRTFFAHGETLRDALTALENKLFSDMDVDERIRLFMKRFPDVKKEYPAMDFFEWHNKLTGSCELGRKAFAKDHGIDIEKDTMTVREFIDLTKNSFGGSVIKQLEEEVRKDERHSERPKAKVY